MLKRFEVSNFRNFRSKLILDLTDVAGYQFNSECISAGYLGKILIYGRNATGKTNLGSAISNIGSMLYTRPPFDDRYFINVDTDEKIATFFYSFQFDNDEIEYYYEKTSAIVTIKERLTINRRVIFDIDYNDQNNATINLGSINAETLNYQRYIDALSSDETEESTPEAQPSFLRWLIANAAFPADSPLMRLYYFVRRMRFISGPNTNRYGRAFLDSFYENLSSGDNLLDFESFLNIMGIPCKLRIERLPDDRFELYFDHGQKKVPFRETASSGTLGLMDVYRRIILSQGITPTFLYLDEFDAFYHYEMAEKVVEYFKQAMPHCQVILTTHNTNLMSNHIMRPDCLLILSSQGKLTSLMNATPRELREGHNLEKMYISGEFKLYE